MSVLTGRQTPPLYRYVGANNTRVTNSVCSYSSSYYTPSRDDSYIDDILLVTPCLTINYSRDRILSNGHIEVFLQFVYCSALRCSGINVSFPSLVLELYLPYYVRCRYFIKFISVNRMELLSISIYM